MTEAEWPLRDDDYWVSLCHPPFEPGVRKLRLFCFACARHAWPYLHDERSRLAVEVAERYADGGATEDEMQRAEDAARAAYEHLSDVSFEEGMKPEYDSRPLGADGVTTLVVSIRQMVVAGKEASTLAGQVANGFYEVSGTNVLAFFCSLLRDIFGNPFRPVTFSPEWRTDTAIALARQMYDSRDFGAMPILADALQDAGCDNDDILGHCRGPVPHVRGCWVVDLVLDKA